MVEKPYPQTANVVSEKSNIGLSVKNLIAIVSAVGIGVWSYFGLTQRITELETAKQLMEADLLKAADQKVIDQEQTMLVEWLAKNQEGIQKDMQPIMSNQVNIEFLKEQVATLQKKVEKLQDKIRENGNN
jgi:uncharacterized protein HemX